MPISLPSSPTVGQTYTLGGKIWTWNGTAWKLPSTTGVLPVLYGGTGVTTSTGTGSTVLSANPTFTGTVNTAAITTSGNVGVGGASGGYKLDVIGGVTSLRSGLRLGIDLNIGNYSRAQLNSAFSLDSTGASAFGWNYSNGGGELDLFINRNGGGTGGLYIYDFPNTSGNPALIFNVTGAGVVTIPGTLSTAAYTETIVALGTVAAAATLAITAGTFITATLTSATACTFTMPTVAAGKSFILYLRQPAAGTPTTATFTNVKWGVAGAPTITATVGKMDILSFSSDGTAWYGAAAQGYTY